MTANDDEKANINSTYVLPSGLINKKEENWHESNETSTGAASNKLCHITDEDVFDN